MTPWYMRSGVMWHVDRLFAHGGRSRLKHLIQRDSSLASNLIAGAPPPPSVCISYVNHDYHGADEDKVQGGCTRKIRGLIARAKFESAEWCGRRGTTLTQWSGRRLCSTTSRTNLAWLSPCQNRVYHGCDPSDPCFTAVFSASGGSITWWLRFWWCSAGSGSRFLGGRGYTLGLTFIGCTW
jgi:hypothetical protein